MNEITIVRDSHENKWHVRYIEAEGEDIGLTLCGDGDGWKMKPWNYENVALYFETGCQDCILGLAEIVNRARSQAETERYVRAILEGGCIPIYRSSLSSSQVKVAERLVEEGVARKDKIRFHGSRRVAYYGVREK